MVTFNLDNHDDGSDLDHMHSCGGDNTTTHQDTTETYSSTTRPYKPDKDEDDLHHASETQRVQRGKRVVYTMLALAAVAVSTVTYFLLNGQQEDTMQANFEGYSREILKQAQANADKLFQDLNNLGKDVTSHALANQLTWPNVTVPHLNVRARDATVEFVGLAPFVTPDQRQGWEAYAVTNQDWIAEEYRYAANGTVIPDPLPTIPPHIHHYNTTTAAEEDVWDVTEMYADQPLFQYEIPLWQVAPPRPYLDLINLDLSSVPILGHLLWDVRVKKVEQYGRIMDLSYFLGKPDLDDHPRGTIYQPVFQDFTEDPLVVGFMLGVLSWDKLFTNLLLESSQPIWVEIQGTCNALFTYRVTGGEGGLEFWGYGSDLRDTKYDKYRQTVDLLKPLNSRPGDPPVKHTHRTTDASHPQSHCTYVMHTYPTAEFYDAHQTNEPLVFSLVICGVFFFTTLVFYVYDRLVQRRQHKLLSTAKSTNAILSSMFPKDVQRRILEEARQQAEQQEAAKKAATRSRRAHHKTSARMTDFLSQTTSGGYDDDTTERSHGMPSGKPIADLFPSATIMFADISGFTAWSSTREPTQVFSLLETLYGTFDKIAKRTGVFKVETIGDCYVAVCGLPTARSDHAVVMARFARECLLKMQDQLMFLETSLGPDTASLGMRIGLHSGSVTAGVLRGDRARFQLFGDAVNTTSRIETTGQKNRIHISEQTAQLIIAANKEGWIEEREDMVEAKGKGKLRTYWLKNGVDDTASLPSSTSSHHAGNKTESHNVNHDKEDNSLSKKDLRLVEWNVDILSRLLRQLQAQRQDDGTYSTRVSPDLEQQYFAQDHGVLDDVQDIISLPALSDRRSDRDYVVQADQTKLAPEVEDELRQFVAAIASMYNKKNSFHNFEHAAHVTMSTCKLLSRVVESGDMDSSGNNPAEIIKADALTQFGMVLSAMIHDVDHPGVPNTQLVKEGNHLSKVYRAKSVAEQNSVDLAFRLLVDVNFTNLRAAIYTTENEAQRFRQIIINAVMATDVMDKDLGAARKARWNKAFSKERTVESVEVESHRKATIVMEHLIQASDVAHTMQHWHIYVKWNERLFYEMLQAFRDGRADKNPADFWYEGELAFFDFYVIPLATKLSTCGVFGVASDEYLGYARHNRAEWEAKGKAVVAEYVNKSKE